MKREKNKILSFKSYLSVIGRIRGRGCNLSGLCKKNKGTSHLFEIASAATSTEEIWNGVGNPVYPSARVELAKHGISCEGK